MHREVFPQWCQPPVDPGLRKGRIDVWRIDLASAADARKPPVSALADGAPGRSAAATGQRAAAHHAMQQILGRYLDRPAADLQLKVQPGGKPYLDTAEHKLEFNLSHSRDIALLAVSTESDVGIDVERYREVDQPLRLARRVMSDEECAELAALPGEVRMDRFLNLWTRMEARQKAIGRGIFAQPADPALLSSFSFRPGQRLYASLSVSPPITDPELRFLDFGPL